MAFRQDQKNSPKYKVSQSPQLIEAVISNEKSYLEIQDELDLVILTDADLEEAPLKLVDDEGVPDVDEAFTTERAHSIAGKVLRVVAVLSPIRVLSGAQDIQLCLAG